MKSSAYNVAIIPPDFVKERAITFSNSLSRKGGLFVLDGKNYSPHVTVYKTQLPDESIGKIKKNLSSLFSHETSFKLEESRLTQAPNGYICIDYKPSRQILGLQKRIVGATNELRQGLIIPSDEKELSDLKKQEQDNLRKYGYAYFGKAYIPHLTLTKLPVFRGLSLTAESYGVSFSAAEIGLFKAGEFGTCRKLISKFKLK